MPTAVHRMSVEEFGALPEHLTQFCELRDGEVVHMAPPKHRHVKIQDRIFDALADVCRPFGKVRVEMPFALNGFDLREADVGVASWARWNAIDDDGYLSGAPDLVIEVLSASNTTAEMLEREARCLSNGCVEFWTANPIDQTIRVATASTVRIYPLGDEVTSNLFPGWSVPVAQLFA
ncbi:MAG: Uma2 family endonuclease [Acidobacteria bacterium]|nr:Uma2 family endonuclease [Acidobacteriota bacterium]